MAMKLLKIIIVPGKAKLDRWQDQTDVFKVWYKNGKEFLSRNSNDNYV